MPTVKLTDRTVQNAQGPAEIWDANLPNFGLRIGAPNERWSKGRKTWQAMYRINGGPKKRLKLTQTPLRKRSVLSRASCTVLSKSIEMN